MGHSITRRSFIASAAAPVAALALPTRRFARSRRTQPVVITFAFGADDSGTLAPLIEQFNDRHAGRIRVVQLQMARNSDDYYRQLESDFLVDSREIDIFGADVVWTATFATRGWVEDLSRRFYSVFDPADFLEAAINSVAYRFRIWGVPWFTDAGVLFYRKDLLSAHGYDGPPSTWGQLQEMARTIMDGSGVPHGFVFQGAEYEGGVANALEYIWSGGGRVLTGNVSVTGAFGQTNLDPNVITVDSDGSARGLDLARSLVADGIAPRDVTEFNELASSRVFLRGDSVFMRNWPTTYSLALDPSTAGLSTDQIGVSRLPAGAGGRRYCCLGGWNLMISERSDRAKKDAAWDFIRFLVDSPQQRTRAVRGGFLPVTERLYDDPELVAAAPVIGLGRDAVRTARIRPVSPFYMQMSPRIARAFHRVLHGELDGVQAARTLQRELETILRRNR